MRKGADESEGAVILVVTHVALRVANLREAERFYIELFGLEVAFREAETPEGWKTLPPHADWDDAEGAGISLGLSLLYRHQLAIALEAASSVRTDDGLLSHVGIQVTADELEDLRTRSQKMGCRLVVDRPTTIVIDDPYRVRWELTVSSYADPPSLSSGAARGDWLEL